MADFPAMPLWTDAYLADTRHLSDAEHGRYLLILMEMWRAPGCRFPNDRAWLERRFRRSPEAFEAEIRPLLEEFFRCDGNWWTQKRLASEWHRLRGTSRKQSDRAKARWDKEKGRCRGNASAAMPYPEPYNILDSSLRSESETPAGVDDPDLDALFYRKGKALLGRNSGGQLTKLRAAVGLGAALEIIDHARHKESPAEYVAGCIRNRGNGASYGRPATNQRASVVGAVQWLDERREEDHSRARDDAPAREVREFERG